MLLAAAAAGGTVVLFIHLRALKAVTTSGMARIGCHSCIGGAPVKAAGTYPELTQMTLNLKLTHDLSSENGSVLVEFCLILPVLVLLFVGVADLGLGVQQAMVVSEAAHAGTAYSSLPGKSSDLQGMQNAAVAAAGNMSPFSATATNWCSCNANGSPVSCSSTCGGASPLEYAQVKTSATLPVVLGYPGLPASFSLNGFSAVRVH